MLAAPDLVDLIVHEFAGLGRRRLARALVLARLLDRPFGWHRCRLRLIGCRRHSAPTEYGHPVNDDDAKLIRQSSDRFDKKAVLSGTLRLLESRAIEVLA
jgi:hypothetical protein